MSEKIKVYDKGIILDRRAEHEVYQRHVGYRTGDMWAPRLDNVEALAGRGRSTSSTASNKRRDPTLRRACRLCVSSEILEAAITVDGASVASRSSSSPSVRRSRRRDSVRRPQAQYQSIKAEIDDGGAQRCSTARQFVLGSEVAAFEQRSRRTARPSTRSA